MMACVPDCEMKAVRPSPPTGTSGWKRTPAFGR